MKLKKSLLPFLVGAAIAVPATLSMLPTPAQNGPIVVGPVPLPPPGAVTMFFDSFFSDNLGQPANDFNGFIQWNVTGGTVDFLGGRVIGANDPVNGRFVDLDGGTPGRFQTRIPFAFAPSTTYNISFTYMSTDGKPNSALIGIGSKRLRVATSSATMQSFSQNFSFSTAETAPLFFQDEGHDDHGIGIDNVVLSVYSVAPTPVPNPTATPVAAPTATATPGVTPGATATPSATGSPTATPSGTPSSTPTAAPTAGPAPTNGAPTNLSLRPTRVATASNVLQSFTATVSDPNGAGDIDRVVLRASDLRFNNHALIAIYSATQNRLFLYDDSGVRLLGGIAPGASGLISNSQGSLDCGATTVARSGNTLTVSFALRAAASQSGMVLPLMLLTYDKAGLRDGYELRGYWTITGNGRPSNISLSPATATNRPNETRLFRAVYSDPNGFANLRQVRLRARAASAKTQADFFSVVYDVQSDRLLVVNDTNTGFVRSDGARPGTQGTVSNRFGTLDVGATRVLRSGNTLTVSWAIRASGRFTGSHAISLIAQDPSLRTPEQTLGTWNVVASAPPTG